MSSESPDPSELSNAARDFVLEVAMEDGLSASVTDDDEIVVTCKSHDADSKVKMGYVFTLARNNGMVVTEAEAQWESKLVELVCVEVDDDWS